MRARRFLLPIALLFALGCAAADPSAPEVPVVREDVINISSTLAVSDLDAALRELRERTDQVGGHVSRSERSRADRATLTLRVPAGEVHAIRALLDALDGDRTEGETQTDVTLAHADLEARLRSARATEGRILTLLAERTAVLADVLAAERELDRIRTQIEELDAADRVLRDQVSLATLGIVLVTRRPSFIDEPVASIRWALEMGSRAAYGVVVSVTVMLALVAPGLLPLLIALGGARLARRRWHGRVRA